MSGNSTITINLHLPQIINQIATSLHTTAKHLVTTFVPWAFWNGFGDVIAGLALIGIAVCICRVMVSIIEKDNDDSLLAFVVLCLGFILGIIGAIVIKHGFVGMVAPKAVAIEHIINMITGS
ncbi:MAG: hypothetical protein GXO10_02910 [Crenarchaeota archaeon]|nr:hypothetical protein [Thermoproteota archaeon]